MNITPSPDNADELGFISWLFEKVPDPRVRWRALFAGTQRLVEWIIGKKTVRLSSIQDILAFASHCSGLEILALKIDIKRSFEDEKLARELTIRFFEWMAARARWWEHIGKKACPAQYDSTKDIATASWAGWLASHQENASDQEVIEFLKTASGIRPEAFEAFKRQMANPKAAGWRHPELDFWLFNVWPIVDRYGWRYSDVWKTAFAVFDEDGPPFESSKSFRKHCLVLGLKTRNKRSGPADYASPPPHDALAKRIPHRLPVNLLPG